MKILDKIDKPSDLKLIRKELFPQLIDEIREEIIRTVSKTGGHLASSLGTVELILALHYVFNVPEDKIIFDVGHQAYTHKLITGRRDKFHTLRQYMGISGFPSRNESKYDIFGTGHSSTAISAALGFAVARDLRNENYNVISVIGDGSITGGLAFEGLNNAGHLGKNILVILNDNEMFISHRVGAIASYLTRLLTLGLLKKLEKKIELFLGRLHYFGLYLLRITKRFKLLFFPGMLFEEMGFAYLGPISGHDFWKLVEILNKIKNFKGPVLLHVITKKGKGYIPSEKTPTKFHGVTKFEVSTGEMEKTEQLTFSKVFGNTLVKLAENDEKIIAITAAMCEGTELTEFSKKFPLRFFDVGIAEQHALTFASGLAADGFRPVCAIYSTFLQRGYDQLIHDIALQNLPVIIAIDRAGIVGSDGATHQGIFDLSYLRLIPNFVIMAPKDENELKDMLYSSFKYNKPVAIRYPKGKVIGVNISNNFNEIPLGKGEILKQGIDGFIIAIGNMVYPSLKASDIIYNEKKLNFGVINIRFLKPIDENLLKNIFEKVKYLVTVEENVLIGGLNSAIREIIPKSDIKIIGIGLPDKFIEHGSEEILYNKYGLTPEKISLTILNNL